eukprot:1930021-Pleurochrysis_carterae.AAC.2
MFKYDGVELIPLENIGEHYFLGALLGHEVSKSNLNTAPTAATLTCFTCRKMAVSMLANKQFIGDSTNSVSPNKFFLHNISNKKLLYLKLLTLKNGNVHVGAVLDDWLFGLAVVLKRPIIVISTSDDTEPFYFGRHIP